MSYTRSDTNSKPLALEVKLERDKLAYNDIERLRQKHNVSQNKLHSYIDHMFEKEKKEKQQLQRYLHQKKLE